MARKIIRRRPKIRREPEAPVLRTDSPVADEASAARAPEPLDPDRRDAAPESPVSPQEPTPIPPSEPRPAPESGFEPRPSSNSGGSYDALGEGVSDILRRTREGYGRDIGEVAQLLNIRRPYLEAIENHELERLPGMTYAVGFVRTYAEYLNLDPNEMVRRFKEEEAGLEQPTELVFPSPVPESRLPGAALVLISLVCFGLAYGAWTYLSESDSSVADLIPEVPERLASLLGPGQGDEDTQSESQGATAPAASDSASAGATDIEATDVAVIDPAAAQEPAAEDSATEVPVAEPAPQKPVVEVEAPDAPDTAPDTAPGTITESAAESISAAVSEPAENAVPEVPAAPVQEVALQTPEVAPEPAEEVAAQAEPEAVPEVPPAPSLDTPEIGAESVGTDVAPEVVPAPTSEPALEAVTEAPVEDEGLPPLPSEIVPSAPEVDVAALPAAPAEVFGASNLNSRVTLQAVLDSWIQVRDAEDDLILSRVLRAGESYRVPGRPGMSLVTGNAGGLEIVVDGENLGNMGAVGKVRRDVALDPDQLLQGVGLRP